MLDVSVVMFAIQGGVRLYGAVRTADADAKRMAGLNLPLPLAAPVQFSAASRWFRVDDAGKAFAAADKRLSDLLDPAAPVPSNDDQAWVIEQYRIRRPLPSFVSVESAVALLEVEQWTKDDPTKPRSPVRRVAGEVINLAVDYFAHAPGAVSDDRPEGKALKAALEAIDGVDFSQADPRVAAGQIVLAVIGAVAKNPEIAGGGERQRLLVGSVAAALAKSAAEHLDSKVPNGERLDAGEWLRLIGASVLQGGVDAATAHPDVLLGKAVDPEKTVAFDVAKTVADLVIGDDKLLTFRGVLSGEGLHTVMKATVESLARNPDALGPDRRGLRTILLSVATDLAKADSLPQDLGPEIARLVLEKTAASLDKVWPEAGDQDASKHLLLVATKSVLSQLAAADGNFGKDEVVGVIEAVLDEVVDHPQPFIDAATSRSADLGSAVGAALKALASVPGKRIDGASAAAAVQAAVLAVVANHDLLDMLPAGARDAGKSFVEAAVGAVTAELFRDTATEKAKWNLARSSVVAAMSAAALDALAKKGVTAPRIEKLRAFVAAWVAEERPFDAEAFAQDLASALAA